MSGNDDNDALLLFAVTPHRGCEVNIRRRAEGNVAIDENVAATLLEQTQLAILAVVAPIIVAG